MMTQRNPRDERKEDLRPVPPQPNPAADRETMIAELAQRRWAAAGRPANRWDEFWREAENEVNGK